MREPHFSIEVTSAPAAYPVTVAEMRAQVNQNHTDDDTYLGTLIAAATKHAEKYTGKYFITQTLKIRWDTFPCGRKEIVLPFAPIQSVTSLTYLDTEGTEQTLSTSLYDEDIYSLPPRIYPAVSQVWPTTQDIQNAVRLVVVAGYGDDGSDCPPNIVHAIKGLAAHWYRNRESINVGNIVAVLPQFVESLLDAERINWL